MPALYNAETDQDEQNDKPLEIKFPRQTTEHDQEDFLQIEDQDKNEALATKKSIMAPTGRA